VLPGKGKEQSEFVGLEKAPVALEEKGLRIILVTGRLGSLRPGSPIYYRGIEVGAVRESQLSPNAAAVTDPRVYQAPVHEAGSEWLEVLEFEWYGRELQSISRVGNQHGVAEVACVWRYCLRDPR